MQREVMEYDVVVVGAGPAGLSAAIRLKQRIPGLRVCVLEKGAEVGAHILSGCAFDPRALTELLPDWQERGAPLTAPAGEDRFLLLTERKSIPLPVPPGMRNQGNYVISLGLLCRWLATQAEALGVEIFPGFPAAAAIIEEGQLCGVVTGDFGRAKDGSHKPEYQPGVEVRGRTTLLAEGCRGSLSEQLMVEFDLRLKATPQSYGIGVKEIWEIDPARHRKGDVLHTIGWPLSSRVYGGSFLYHMDRNQLAIGLIVGLDYENPYLSPFQEFQRLKLHPAIRPLLEGGRRVAYGARALNEGGLQSLPHLVFPGGALIGCSAGFLNVGRIKGSHLAMKSGTLAADALADGRLALYPERFRNSWAHRELHEARNIRPAFHKWGLWGGMAYSALDTFCLRGRAPWTLRNRMPDHASLKPARECEPIAYPPPDGKISFDLMSSVYLSNTNHDENQPCHLLLKDAAVPVSVNLAEYDGPEARYCPAGVYEYVPEADGARRLHINAPNCVHCKTCDIKDPTQNIVWTTPEGGGGPNYGEM